MRRVVIAARFRPDDVRRTGLTYGLTLPVFEVEGDPRIWVKCPEIPRKVHGEFRMWSDGYAVLNEGEFEEI